MSKKNRCPYCNSTQTNFLRRKKIFRCYECDDDDWEVKPGEEMNGS